jgi:uncharacterized protein (DUF433 family)
VIESAQQPHQSAIVEIPDVNGGFPVIAPTRIAVRLVVEAFRESGDVGRVVGAFPQLTREQVQAALDFYREHPERVDEDIERNARALRSIRSH